MIELTSMGRHALCPAVEGVGADLTATSVPLPPPPAISASLDDVEHAEWTPRRVVPQLSAPATVRGTTRRTRPGWLVGYRMSQVTCDALIMMVVAGCTLFMFGPTSFASSDLLILTALVLPVLWLACLALVGSYSDEATGVGSEEFRLVGQAGLLALGVAGFLSFSLHLNISRGFVISVVPAATVLTLIVRYLLRQYLHRLRYAGRCLKVAVAVGREDAVLDLVSQLRDERHTGMRIVAACIPHGQSGKRLMAAGIPVAGTLDDVPAVIESYAAETIAVTSASETAGVYLRRLSWELEGSGVELLVSPGLVEVAGPRLHIRPFIGLPLLQLEEPEFGGRRRLIKGAVDRFLAAIAVVVTLPVLLGLAIAVWLDDRGPVLFRQERIGRNGQPFIMYKFRSMRVGADAEHADMVARIGADPQLAKDPEDPRVTRLGRVMRRLSLDELPQLINIVNGSMSLVGPRPPLRSEVALYDHSYSRRLLVKPGLTGLWQISGRSNLTLEESVRLDLRYVENWSLALDALILWKTFFALVRPDGAY